MSRRGGDGAPVLTGGAARAGRGGRMEGYPCYCGGSPAVRPLSEAEAVSLAPAGPREERREIREPRSMNDENLQVKSKYLLTYYRREVIRHGRNLSFTTTAQLRCAPPERRGLRAPPKARAQAEPPKSNLSDVRTERGVLGLPRGVDASAQRSRAAEARRARVDEEACAWRSVEAHVACRRRSRAERTYHHPPCLAAPRTGSGACRGAQAAEALAGPRGPLCVSVRAVVRES